MDDIFSYEFEKIFPDKDNRYEIRISNLTDEQLDILLYSSAKLKVTGEVVILCSLSE